MYVLFFFFQAEDGIRDLTVTGVQTCALPISGIREDSGIYEGWTVPLDYDPMLAKLIAYAPTRSEERRVGKSVDLGGRRIIKKKKNNKYMIAGKCLLYTHEPECRGATYAVI